MTTGTLVEVDNFSLEYRHGDGWLRAVDGVSFSVETGEVFGLVGESGCGKSSLAYNLVGYHAPSARVRGGRILFSGRDLLTLDRAALNELRGAAVGLVPQNPTTALNPAMRVGRQLTEVLVEHGVAANRDAARRRALELFDRVGLPTPKEALGRYPHELSGGQQQRVCIAMALACNPALVVLDEPTTGLDVTTQAQIIALLKALRERHATAMVYVTHDLSVLAQLADRIGVMYVGRMVEVAPVDDLFERPRHPYTRGLIASIPRIEPIEGQRVAHLRGLLRRDDLPPGCPFAPRCDYAEPACAAAQQELERAGDGHWVACRRWRAIGEAAKVAASAVQNRQDLVGEVPILELDDVTVTYAEHGLLGRLIRQPLPAVNAVSFAIAPAETFALVGESGSGKSTLAKAISGLISPSCGTVRFGGKALAPRVMHREREITRRIQYIFQNPDASLNPRMRVGASLSRPLAVLMGLKGQAARRRIDWALEEVRLEPRYAPRFPDQLSGGERQRVAIARALVADPALLLCDEVLSALDVSVQANILDLLRRLRAETNVAMLFISHDLAVVRVLADRVGVLFRGTLVEIGEVEAVFGPPHHPYTDELLSAVPGRGRKSFVSEEQRRPGLAVHDSPTSGCPYAGRCARSLGAKCESEQPPWQEVDGLRIRCHIPIADLGNVPMGGDPNRSGQEERRR